MKIWFEVSKLKRINNVKKPDENLTDFINRAVDYLLVKLEQVEMNKNDNRGRKE